jgi:hypothetical protein
MEQVTEKNIKITNTLKEQTNRINVTNKLIFVLTYIKNNDNY